MKLLLDTCTFVWLASVEGRLSRVAAEMFSDPENEVYLSAVSAWEIGVKHRNGKMRLPGGIAPREFVTEARLRHGIASLPMMEADVFPLEKLPPHHQDPFDRLLICQAIANQMAILTPDEAIRQYPISTYW